jgi:hypothetical protein
MPDPRYPSIVSAVRSQWPCALAIPAIAALFSCGGTPATSSDPAPRIVTPQAELCAGAPPEEEDHVVTAVSCPFIQQTANVVRFGVALGQPTELHDAKGAIVARVTHTCDAWALGTDPQGVTVVIRRDSGEVVSHGIEHPGQPISALASPLDAPLTIP